MRNIQPDITVNELLDSYFNVYRKTEFPVVEEHDNLIGAVTTKEAINVEKSSKDTIKVALKRITRENKSRIFVYEEDRERTPAGGREEGLEIKK